MSALKTLQVLTGVTSAACIGGAVFNGQKIGNPLHFLEGAVGLNKENYYEDHGTESGTFMGALGGTTDNFVAIGTKAALTSKSTINKAARYLGKGNAKLLRGVAPLFMGWQVAQGTDEFMRGDGDPVKDKMDLAGNIFNIILVGSALKKGNFSKTTKALKGLIKRIF